MLFMVIERFKSADAASAVYERFAKRGRMLPDGLEFIDSWVEENLNRCFQLMETEDPRLFAEWIRCWDDLVDFEVIPVTNTAAAARKTGHPKT